MIETDIYARNLKLTPRLEGYVEKKMERLGRYLPNIANLRVDLTSQRARNASERLIAQVTVRDERGMILRAEEQSGDIFAAVDAVVDKMYRQIKRYRGKQRRRRRGTPAPIMELEPLPIEDMEEEDADAKIVRVKEFMMHPMSPEEAMDQLELLGHDFYVFFNAGTNHTNVIYRRKDGDYGLLQPEFG